MEKREMVLDIKRIDLIKNINLCLNFGYGSLITARNEMDFRNSIISVHNGIELLMKYYLISKNPFLIYRKPNHYCLIHERSDLIKKITQDKLKLETITFLDCLNYISFFMRIPENDLKQLNDLRNSRVHFEYISNHSEIKKILISYVYPFIYEIVKEMGLNLWDFLRKEYIHSLDIYKKSINDELRHQYHEKIEIAKKHYFEELTEDERIQKKTLQDYKLKNKYDKIVICPACGNDSLLRMHVQVSLESNEFTVISRNIVLKDLSCHHCGFVLEDRDLLRLKFKEEEKTLPNLVISEDCPDDCDCLDDCDCPTDCPYDCTDDCDCPNDCDCPYDCPYDCPDDCDCPNDYDCPYDCPDDCDCPYDCPYDDCPDDCDCPI